MSVPGVVTLLVACIVLGLCFAASTPRHPEPSDPDDEFLTRTPRP